MEQIDSVLCDIAQGDGKELLERFKELEATVGAHRLRSLVAATENHIVPITLDIAIKCKDEGPMELLDFCLDVLAAVHQNSPQWSTVRERAIPFLIDLLCSKEKDGDVHVLVKCMKCLSNFILTICYKSPWSYIGSIVGILVRSFSHKNLEVRRAVSRFCGALCAFGARPLTEHYEELTHAIVQCVCRGMNTENELVLENAVLAIARMLGNPNSSTYSLPQVYPELIPALCQAVHRQAKGSLKENAAHFFHILFAGRSYNKEWYEQYKIKALESGVLALISTQFLSKNPSARLEATESIIRIIDMALLTDMVSQEVKDQVFNALVSTLALSPETYYGDVYCLIIGFCQVLCRREVYGSFLNVPLRYPLVQLIVCLLAKKPVIKFEYEFVPILNELFGTNEGMAHSLDEIRTYPRQELKHSHLCSPLLEYLLNSTSSDEGQNYIMRANLVVFLLAYGVSEASIYKKHRNVRTRRGFPLPSFNQHHSMTHAQKAASSIRSMTLLLAVCMFPRLKGHPAKIKRNQKAKAPIKFVWLPVDILRRVFEIVPFYD